MQEVDLELVDERLVGAVHVERADVGDRDVDAAEILRARLDPADQCRAIGDVERPAERLDALALQRLHGARHAVGVARADRDVAALGGKRVGDRPPDALAAAGDDRPLASEPEIHPMPSSPWGLNQHRYRISPTLLIPIVAGSRPSWRRPRPAGGLLGTQPSDGGQPLTPLARHPKVGVAATQPCSGVERVRLAAVAH